MVIRDLDYLLEVNQTWAMIKDNSNSQTNNTSNYSYL